MKKIKVFLVDDHAIMRMGLTSLLGTQGDIEVVGDAEDGTMAISKIHKAAPDVVIMDLMMPDMDGIETTRQLLAKHPNVHVLILTTYGTSDGIAHALEAGASGAILKSAKLPEVITAIKAVCVGKTYISPEIEELLANNPPIPELSPRQLEILQSVTLGLTNKDIAKQLGISSPMVNEHLKATFAKIGAANRTEAVAIALRKHLLKM